MKFRDLFVLFFVLVLSVSGFAFGFERGISGSPSNPALGRQLTAYFPIVAASSALDRFEDSTGVQPVTIVPHPTDGGIREMISDRFKERFLAWKTELLSTEFGKSEWAKYENNKDFILTIVVSGSKEKGAGTDKFLWDDQGNLVGATITLGGDIESGFPTPIYYPVLNSLASESTSYSISGKILAATKLSHEIGHVNQAAMANMKFLQLQNKLIPEYNAIMLKNGFRSNDKKLLDLAEQMKGTPVEIWESREYWSEVNAMLYLNARIGKEDFYCFVFKKMRYNVEAYAKSYESRFLDHPEFAGSPCWR